MSDGHERYEALAVGHVLGGLAAREATDFRAHLDACEGCRSHVAELRALASDLAAAERDERSRRRVRTVTPRRAQQVPADPEPPRPGVRAVSILAVVVLLIALAVGFWNLHLRTAVAGWSTVAGTQAETLQGLAGGVRLEADLADGVRGLIVSDGEQVAVALTGMPEPDPGGWLVLWLIGADGEVLEARRLTGSARIGEATVATTVPAGEAHELVLTVEAGSTPQEPAGDQLVRASLDQAAGAG